jgi:hypothetical protein
MVVGSTHAIGNCFVRWSQSVIFATVILTYWPKISLVWKA